MRAPVRQAIVATQLLRASVGRLSAPVKVNLCVTYWCQYRCRTCNIWQRRPEGELTTAELLEFVHRNHGIRWIDIMGGEIFLRKDLIELFDAIATEWPQLAVLHFATNGFMTDRIAMLTARLAARTHARIVVTVSVDGDEALNDHVRGIRGGYRRQIATFNALRAIQGVEVVFGMTLSKHNVGKVDETFHACQQHCPGLRIEDFHVNIAQRSEHYYGNAGDDFAASPVESRAALARYRQRRSMATSPSTWVESRYLHYLDRYLDTGKTPMRCHALRSSCFINPDGDVFPCITDTRKIGSLRETGMALAPIWSSETARATQRDIWSGNCPQCWTACEAYQSILGNLLRPDAMTAARPV
jgi:radical SAM protein with 4Fe4S-binding SPASM domain